MKALQPLFEVIILWKQRMGSVKAMCVFVCCFERALHDRQKSG